MTRALSRIFLSLSFIVCAGAGWEWVRSYSHSDLLTVFPCDMASANRLQIEGQTIQGDLWIVCTTDSKYAPDAHRWQSFSGNDFDGIVNGRELLRRGAGVSQTPLAFVGVYYIPLTVAGGGRGGLTGIPLWLIVIGAAVMPGVAAFRTLIKRKRLQSLRCTRCGYDLRATPHRCPDCGATT